MNRKNMLVKLLNENKSEGKFYSLTVMMTVIFVFNLMNVFHLEGSGYTNLQERVIYGYSILLIIILVIGLTFYSNNYLLEVKSKEIGIEMLGGQTPGELGLALTYQAIILNLKGTGLGVIGSILIIPVFNYFALSEKIFAISTEGIGFTIAIMILQTIMVSIINYGYGYRSDINELFLKREGLTYIKERKRGKKLKWWMYGYFILLVSPLITVFIGDNIEKIRDNVFFFFVMVSSCALYNIINKFIPLYIEKKKEKYLNNKIDLIVLSNVKFKLFNSKNIFYIIVFLTLNFILSFRGNFSYKDIRYNIITLVVGLTLMGFALVYRILSDTLAQAQFLSKLYYIGYLKEDVIKILKKDIKYLISIGVIFPTINILSFMIPLLVRGDIDIILIIQFLCIYIGILIGCYILSKSLGVRILKSKIEGEE